MKKRNRKKRILLVSCHFYPPREGGEQAVFEQMQYLLSKGYSCTSLHFRTWDGRPFEHTKSFKYKGIKMIQSNCENDENTIKEAIAKEEPTIVYTYSFPAPKTLSIARKMGIKTILGVYSIPEIHDIYTGKSTSYNCRRQHVLKNLRPYFG